MSKALSDLFDDCSKTGLLDIRLVGNVRYVYAGNARDVLHLGLYGDPSKNGIDVRFERLRGGLKEKFEDMIVELSRVAGFEWVTNGDWRIQKNKWRDIKNIALQEPNMKQMSRSLLDWLLNVDRLSRELA